MKMIVNKNCHIYMDVFYSTFYIFLYCSLLYPLYYKELRKIKLKGKILTQNVPIQVITDPDRGANFDIKAFRRKI